MCLGTEEQGRKWGGVTRGERKARPRGDVGTFVVRRCARRRAPWRRPCRARRGAVSGALRSAGGQPRRGRWKTCRQHPCPPPALSEEPKTDISLPHKLLWAKKIKERKKILRENHQNAEVEGAAWLQTVLIPLEEARAEWEDQRPLPQAACAGALRDISCLVQGGHVHPLGDPEAGVQPRGQAPCAGLLWEHGDGVRVPLQCHTRQIKASSGLGCSQIQVISHVKTWHRAIYNPGGIWWSWWRETNGYRAK
ncbi:uncharacterized protein LOC141920288 [Strix aluco]|uniref:uncharacterized protein LOC141920288 n=1 Tax=Strix aluco TaxID=111821 RepID=UPI003DA5176B